MWMSVLHICLYHVHSRGLWRSEKGAGAPETGVKDSYATRVLRIKVGHLQEHAFLTTEPPPGSWKKTCYVRQEGLLPRCLSHKEHLPHGNSFTSHLLALTDSTVSCHLSCGSWCSLLLQKCVVYSHVPNVTADVNCQTSDILRVT